MRSSIEVEILKIVKYLNKNMLIINNEFKFPLILFFVICIFSYIIYYDSLFYGESNYDDFIYFEYFRDIFKNGVSLNAILSIFSDFVNANWHPITILSLAIDFVIGDDNPIYFHATNTIIHIVNAMMVFLVFSKLSNNRIAAAIAAVLFTIHPLNIETVVWISERKGLLSALFALASLYFYIRYKKETTNHHKIVSVILFMLSLLSKPTAATFPLIFMLLDLTVYNVNNKVSLRLLFDSLKDKTPYFIVGLVIIVVSFMAQIENGALRDLSAVTFMSRIESGMYNLFIYISKIFLPLNLASFYPQPEKPLYIILLYALFLLSWLLLAFRYFTKSKLITFCILFFFILILPVSGIFQTGVHSIANRYTYLPSVSVIFIISLLLCKIPNPRVSILIALTVIISLVTISLSQVKVWRSSFDMWENNAKVTEANYYTAFSYSMLLIDRGKIDESLNYFYNIIGIENKRHANKAISQFAIRLTKHKKFAEAKVILEKGLESGFKTVEIYRQLALIDYFYMNNKQVALKYIKAILKVVPYDFYSNRIYAMMLAEQKKYSQALKILNFLKTIEPTYKDIDLLNFLNNKKITKDKVDAEFNLIINDDIELILKKL